MQVKRVAVKPDLPCRLQRFGNTVISNLIDKNVEESQDKQQSVYKEFTEEKAKQLYEKLFLYYLKKLQDEKDASNKAKSIINKQCYIRNIKPWNWI